MKVQLTEVIDKNEKEETPKKKKKETGKSTNPNILSLLNSLSMSDLICLLPLVGGSLSFILLAYCKESRRLIHYIIVIALLFWAIYVATSKDIYECSDPGLKGSGVASMKSMLSVESGIKSQKAQADVKSIESQETDNDTTKNDIIEEDVTTDGINKDGTREEKSNEDTNSLVEREEKRQEIMFRPSFPKKDISRDSLMKCAYRHLQEQNSFTDPYLRPVDDSETCICVDKQRFFRTKVNSEMR